MVAVAVVCHQWRSREPTEWVRASGDLRGGRKDCVTFMFEQYKNTWRILI
jgi:hypothetical protein